jgi:ribosomal protein S18 acetylase RimI-like enzyme
MCISSQKTMVKIRSAQPVDYPLIQGMAQEIWPHTFKGILSGTQINYMLEMMYSINSIEDQIEKGHIFILLQKLDEYLGYASYENNYQKSISTKIHKLYISPDHQRKGLGKQLIDYISEIALENGAPSLLLNVNKDNKALLFYQKSGFKTISEEVIPIGNGYVMDDFVMEKNL